MNSLRPELKGALSDPGLRGGLRTRISYDPGFDEGAGPPPFNRRVNSPTASAPGRFSVCGDRGCIGGDKGNGTFDDDWGIVLIVATLDLRLGGELVIVPSEYLYLGEGRGDGGGRSDAE